MEVQKYWDESQVQPNRGYMLLSLSCIEGLFLRLVM
jgi:hypothetical protein